MKHALTTTVGVLTYVPAKQMEIFSVAAELDMDWTAMVKTAVVRTFFDCFTDKKKKFSSKLAIVCFVTDV